MLCAPVRYEAPVAQILHALERGVACPHRALWEVTKTLTFRTSLDALGAVGTPRPTTKLFGQAGRLSYVERAMLALRARPVAHSRFSVIFSAVVLASGTVWLEVSGRCPAANWGLSHRRCVRQPWPSTVRSITFCGMKAVTIQEAQGELGELIAQAGRGELIVLTDGDRQVALEPRALPDLEEDSPELEAELLRAVNGPHAPFSEGDLRELANKALGERRARGQK